ncbi:S24 family peptidase [Acinetobacter sp. ANC 4640]
MQSTSDRILKRMNELKLQHKDIVVATGASKGTVTNWINGVNTPTGSRLIALADTLKTTPDWLITGKDGQQQPSLNIENTSNVRLTGKTLRVIPVLDFVQAGVWKDVIYDGLNPKGETYTSYVGSDDHAVFSLEVDGYSMSPDFQPGDEIVIDAALAPKPGSLVIAQEVQHGIAMTTFKKYRVIGMNEHGVEIIELVPLNPDYPTYNSAQIDISIIGVVVEHHRSLKY